MQDDDTSVHAVGRWQRLAGGLCAVLAWRKAQLAVHLLSSYLVFTEGCAGRRVWLDDRVCCLDGRVCCGKYPDSNVGDPSCAKQRVHELTVLESAN